MPPYTKMVDKKADGCPCILALFQKRIEGDDSLLELAGLRFSQAGMGTEFYAETSEELEGLLAYKPGPETPATVHLKRGLNLFKQEDRDMVIEFAHRGKGKILGLVLHDQPELADDPAAYRDALAGMNSRMAKDGPLLFIEYATGLDIERYTDFFRLVRGLERISACIDTGHVGIWKARNSFAQIHPGMDVCSLRSEDPALPGLLGDVQKAVDSSLPAVLYAVRGLAALGKHVHFHLHDGHPLAPENPFGVSDHMSFFGMIPLPFGFKGRKALDLMYGIQGLVSIVRESVRRLKDKVSFSLEIHPAEGRIPLGDASALFGHWKDTGNAERMNFWLHTLIGNFLVVKEICGKELRREAGGGKV